jgi:hypothetical protein
MDERENSSQRLLGHELQQELSELLAGLQRPPRHRFLSLDRPFVVTVVGGILLAFLTHYWQTNQQLNNLQLDLMRNFPSAFESRGSLLNDWIVHVLWRAEERNRPSEHRNQKEIDRWSSEIVHIEQEYIKTGSLDDLLWPIEITFNSADVHAAIEKLSSKWKEFENLINNTNREYNAKESLTPEEIHSLDISRRKIVDELENSKEGLLKALAISIAGS